MAMKYLKFSPPKDKTHFPISFFVSHHQDNRWFQCTAHCECSRIVTKMCTLSVSWQSHKSDSSSKIQFGREDQRQTYNENDKQKYVNDMSLIMFYLSLIIFCQNVRRSWQLLTTVKMAMQLNHSFGLGIDLLFSL